MKILKTYSRVYTSDLDKTILFYSGLTNQKISQRFKIPDLDVEVAYIGDFIIISGKGEIMNQFRKVHSCCIVENIEKIKAFLVQNNSSVFLDIQTIPSGKNMIIQHPDGMTIEYIELK